MFSIQTIESDSNYLTELYQWFESEWDDVEPLTTMKHGKVIPNAIVALIDGELVGGLVFTRFLSPISQVQAVWINSVFIKPENRKQGISSKLISYAEKQVKQMGEPELLVYTQIPKLYSKLDWKIIETQDDNFVLNSSLVQSE